MTAKLGRAAPLTRAGDVFGTPAYMAPELANGVHDAQPSADIFAFGVLAYEMITGKPPFAEPPIVTWLRGAEIPAPELAGVPDAIARCLELDPAARPTAAELIKACTASP
jgi:serine/threonine-protein kinase